MPNPAQISQKTPRQVYSELCCTTAASCPAAGAQPQQLALLPPHQAAAARGMLSRQSIPPKSGTRTETCGNADGTITGGFHHYTQLLSVPLPSKQLLGSDPVDQAVPGNPASLPAACLVT